MADMQFRILVVPSEHPQGWQITGLLLFREVGERDVAMAGLAVGRDEEQIV